MIALEHQSRLITILARQPELRYGFVASSVGEVIIETGDRTLLSQSGVVDVALRPESIVSFHEKCQEYLKTNPFMVPRLYAQGRTVGVIGPPTKGILLAVFGEKPETIASDSPEKQARWTLEYRNRVWGSVREAYGNAAPKDSFR